MSSPRTVESRNQVDEKAQPLHDAISLSELQQYAKSKCMLCATIANQREMKKLRDQWAQTQIKRLNHQKTTTQQAMQAEKSSQQWHIEVQSWKPYLHMAENLTKAGCILTSVYTGSPMIALGGICATLSLLIPYVMQNYTSSIVPEMLGSILMIFTMSQLGIDPLQTIPQYAMGIAKFFYTYMETQAQQGAIESGGMIEASEKWAHATGQQMKCVLQNSHDFSRQLSTTIRYLLRKAIAMVVGG